MDKDDIKGKAKEAAGYVKDKAGEIMNDPDLEAEGEVEKAEGKAQQAWGKAKDTARDIVDDAKHDKDAA
jgi:uncharacterized protein YjbJ (UPF0337 family)